MNKVDKAWGLFDEMRYQHHCWPTTVSPCDCGRGYGRGGVCALCLEDELAAVVGRDLAYRARAAFEEVVNVWSMIQEEVK